MPSLDEIAFIQQTAGLLRSPADFATGLTNITFYDLNNADLSAVAAALAPVMVATLEAAAPEFEPDTLLRTWERFGAAAVPSLVKLAGGRYARSRALAAAGLAAARAADPAAFDALTWLLDDPAPEVRAEACRALARLRPDAATEPLLLARLADTDPDVVDAALDGLGRFTAPLADETYRAVGRFLDPNRGTPDALCYRALAVLGRADLPDWVLPRLRPLLQRDWKQLRAAGRLMPFLELDLLIRAVLASEAVPTPLRDELEAVLAADDETIAAGVRVRAALLLHRIDPRHRAAVRALELAAASPDRDIRLEVGCAVDDMPPQFQTTVSGLMETQLNDPDDDVRRQARRLFGHDR
jgi:hypothetical protein